MNEAEEEGVKSTHTLNSMFVGRLLLDILRTKGKLDLRLVNDVETEDSLAEHELDADLHINGDVYSVGITVIAMGPENAYNHG